jgi:hypothetical protein
MPISLTGELGFLFDMMLAVNESAQAHPQSVSRVVMSSNFQRALRVTPEAVTSGLFPPSSTGDTEGALVPSPLTSPLSMVPLTPPTIDEVMTLSRGISDGSTSSTGRGMGAIDPTAASSSVSTSLSEAKSIQKKTQIFTKFMFNQMKKEFDADAAHHKAGHIPFAFHDAISATFAFQSITTTVFLNSKTKGFTTYHTAYCSDLALSSAVTSTSVRDPMPSSFAEVLYSTVNKTSHMRGWCAASDSYEPCRQTKRIQLVSVQSIFTLLCGDTLSPRNLRKNASEGKSSAVEQNSWRTRNALGGPWLPSTVEVFSLSTNSSHLLRCFLFQVSMAKE